MESSPPIACQWNGCLSPAEKHAVFGRRVFDAQAEDISKPETPFITKHRDLCSKHLAELKMQYVDVVEMEIDICRDHSTPRRGRALSK